MSDDNFFIILKKVGGIVQGHTIRHGNVDKDIIARSFSKADKESSEAKNSPNEENVESKQNDARSPLPESFFDVERSFSQAMLMYRKSVVETIKFAPLFASVTLGVSAEKIATTRGSKREDLSTEEINVYSIPSHAFGKLKRHTDRADALIEGAKYLPRISTIGIISSYDAILSDLLKVIFKRKPEIIFTSDREVKFSELLNLNTLEAVRDSIISNEIESVIRNSHHEHFSWMERKFGMKLREKLDVWPDFIELCERFGLLPLDFDGRHDSIYHPFDKAGNRHMEYVNQRGAFDDMPLTQIVADFQVVYPTMMREQAQMHAASFQQDVEREVGGG